jgi:hypothetical protein
MRNLCLFVLGGGVFKMFDWADIFVGKRIAGMERSDHIDSNKSVTIILKFIPYRGSKQL